MTDPNVIPRSAPPLPGDTGHPDVRGPEDRPAAPRRRKPFAVTSDPFPASEPANTHMDPLVDRLAAMVEEAGWDKDATELTARVTDPDDDGNVTVVMEAHYRKDWENR